MEETSDAVSFLAGFVQFAPRTSHASTKVREP